MAIALETCHNNVSAANELLLSWGCRPDAPRTTTPSASVAPSVPNHDFVTLAASTSAVAATSPFAAAALAFTAVLTPTPPLPMAPFPLS